MSTTAAQIARVRRITAETGDASSYSDDTLSEYIEQYPLWDSDGYSPDSTEWTPTYDLYRAAAEVWDEKAAAVAGDYDYSGDGATLNRSQVAESYRKEARRCRARAKARTALPIREYLDEPLDEQRS